ncbi:sulfite exporter TauE/SafE family protein [Pseudothauera nasutitermitis]|uniref:sulfite exporter TauE/SafE family protein n=1 Tax=Pseudothauera nasutitermitis TaxID=2565930 RepID=UPI001B3B2C99|nr:sulfite exporter TauE/SafE family protein [Pseudothauera nasutitermitis]
MDSVIWVVILGAGLAGFVQGLSGFGFGLVAVSVWAWVLEPRLAAALAVFGALTGQLIAAAAVRRAFDPRLLGPFVLGGLCGLPLGVLLLPHLDMLWFRTLLGTLLVLWCPAMLMARHLPRITRGGVLADAAVGLGGGVLAGLGGFTGTLPTLWGTLRGFDKHALRTVVQNFNLAMLLAAMAAYLATGMVTRDMLPHFAVVAPALLLPALLGTRVYNGLGETRFRQIVLGLLTVSGLALLASSLPRLLTGLAAPRL